MTGRKTAIAISCIIVAISAFTSVTEADLASVAVQPSCTVWHRLAYSFFHANIFHAIVNSMCLLSVFRYYRVSAWNLAFAYIIAASFPVDTMSRISPQEPTVGLSAACFALMAMVSWQARSKAFFHLYAIAFIAATFAMAHIIGGAMPNHALHIYSYVVGLTVGFLNYPFINES